MRLSKLCLCICALTLVSACVVPEDEWQRGYEVSAEPEPTEPAEADDKATPLTPPEAKPKPPALPPRAGEPQPSAMDPQGLMGRGEEEITQLLGDPREVRNDPPAMVWKYTVDGCALDLFFYLDLKSQDFRALAYNFEPTTTSDGEKKACLARIQEANRDRRR